MINSSFLPERRTDPLRVATRRPAVGAQERLGAPGGRGIYRSPLILPGAGGEFMTVGVVPLSSQQPERVPSARIHVCRCPAA